MGGEEHRGQGAPVMAKALPNGKGHTGRRKRPRSIAEEPKHGRCRDEVRRYGCGEKPIQNPYGHEKTGHFTAPQDTISNEKKNAIALAPQRERDNKLHHAHDKRNRQNI